MLACVDQSASSPSCAVERSAAFPGLVGVRRYTLFLHYQFVYGCAELRTTESLCG